MLGEEGGNQSTQPPTLLSPDDHPVKKCHIKSMWVPTRALNPRLKVYTEKQVAFISEILGFPKKKQRHYDSHWQGQRSLTGLTDCEQSRCLRLYWYVDPVYVKHVYLLMIGCCSVSETYTDRCMLLKCSLADSRSSVCLCERQRPDDHSPARRWGPFVSSSPHLWLAFLKKTKVRLSLC